MLEQLLGVSVVKTVALFFITAIAEIVGCYFAYLMFVQQKSAWLWLPMMATLMIFAWLLSLHPEASGRVYAMYGGIYICTALLWLRLVDGVQLTAWDIAGGLIVLVGALVIIMQPAQGRL